MPTDERLEFVAVTEHPAGAAIARRYPDALGFMLKLSIVHAAAAALTFTVLPDVNLTVEQGSDDIYFGEAEQPGVQRDIVLRANTVNADVSHQCCFRQRFAMEIADRLAGVVFSREGSPYRPQLSAYVVVTPVGFELVIANHLV
jgi:hypothetical protein